MNNIRAQRVSQIEDIIIVHVCKKCKRRLYTYWDNDNELAGEWLALDTMGSEIFETYVANPKEIVCLSCLADGGI